MQLRAIGQVTALAVWMVMSVSAWSKPAPWFWWVSLHDGERVCAQFMPSAGWRQAEGPFHNAQCRPQRGALIMGR